MQLICQALKALIYRKILLNQPIKPAVAHQIRAAFNENAYMRGVHRLPHSIVINYARLTIYQWLAERFFVLYH